MHTRAPVTRIQRCGFRDGAGVFVQSWVRTVSQTVDETRYQGYEGELYHAKSFATRAKE
jgi:hypothetical protein